MPTQGRHADLQASTIDSASHGDSDACFASPFKPRTPVVMVLLANTTRREDQPA